MERLSKRNKKPKAVKFKILRTDCMCWIIIAIQKKKDVKGPRTGTLDLVYIIIKNLLTGTGKY